MKKFKILSVMLIGLMVLTGCQTNAKEMTGQGAKAKAGKKTESTASDYNFSVITVGTGTPKFSETHADASTVIQYNGEYYLVDCGDGSNRNLEMSNFDFKNLRAMLFTHHHMDHTTDFFDIYTKSFLANDDEIDIIGPPRTEKFVEFYNDVYLDDLLYRKSNLEEVDESYKDVILNYANTSEVVDKGNFNIDGLNIEAAKMTHTMYDLAYKFEADNHSIVVTGDTTYDENLFEFAKDADILVIDGALYKEKENSNKITRKYITPFYEYGGNFEVSPHLTFDEMVETAVKCNVSTLVITHYGDAEQDRIDKSISKIKEKFDGEVIYAEDMQEIGIDNDEETNANDDKDSGENEEDLTNSYNIVDTNQNEFYSDKDIITEPSEGQSYYGQDASYDGNSPSYTNNNDGTISDNITGLMWAQDMGEKMTYDEAVAFAENSTLGGYDDWRIPSIKELYSLIEFDGRVMGETATDDLFIDTNYFNQPLGDTSIGEREIDAQLGLVLNMLEQL